MSIGNLSPRDLVTIVTKDGHELQAEVVMVKRDRIQLNVVGPWLTDQQHRDAHQSVDFRNIATVRRTGRAEDRPVSHVPPPPTKAPNVPSYIANFFQSMRAVK